MKHPITPTLKLLGWLLGGVLVTFAALPNAMKNVVEVPVSQGSFISIIMLMIGLGLGMWLFFMKNASVESLRIFMAIGLGTIGSRALFTFIGNNQIYTSAFLNIVMSLSVMVVLGSLMYLLARSFRDYKSRKDKPYAWRYAVLSTLATANNVFYVFVIPTIGVVYGLMIEPIYAAILLTAVALYDAWAVWKAGVMQKLAKFLMGDLGAFPGYLVTYEDKKKKDINVGFLGGGDVFFLSLVPVSFMAYDVFLGAIVMACMTISIVALFLMSNKKPYPAIPFMWAGMVVGYAIWWV